MQRGDSLTDRKDLHSRIFQQEIRPWLPSRMVDIHCHVSLKENCGPIPEERLRQNWALEVGVHQTWEALRANYSLLLPGIEVRALVFGAPFREMDIAADNRYVLQGVREAEGRASALYVVRPEETPEAVERALDAGFLGLKPYPDLAEGPGGGEPGVFDMLPKTLLRVLDRRGGILMLHLPRKGRLADEDNIREVSELVEEFPNVRTVLAHVGRAYCLPNAERGLPRYPQSPNLLFDISANVNADVFALALEVAGPGRLLFGSDLPVTRMRLKRECVGDDYINYTDEDYSWNTRRKSPEEEALYTYFLYEELRGLIEAARRRGLTPGDLEPVLRTNGERLLDEAAPRP